MLWMIHITLRVQDPHNDHIQFYYNIYTLVKLNNFKIIRQKNCIGETNSPTPLSIFLNMYKKNNNNKKKNLSCGLTRAPISEGFFGFLLIFFQLDETP